MAQSGVFPEFHEEAESRLRAVAGRIDDDGQRERAQNRRIDTGVRRHLRPGGRGCGASAIPHRQKARRHARPRDAPAARKVAGTHRRRYSDGQ